MKVHDWENTYKTKGVVQEGILPTVEQSVQIMLHNKCKRVLDLGCGTGRHTLFLAQNNFEVYGTDISQTAIDSTRQRALQLNFNVKLYAFTGVEGAILYRSKILASFGAIPIARAVASSLLNTIG